MYTFYVLLFESDVICDFGYRAARYSVNEPHPHPTSNMDMPSRSWAFSQ